MQRTNDPSRRRTAHRWRPEFESLEDRRLLDGNPFRATSAVSLGTVISRPGYDYQPTILFDPNDSLDANHNHVPDRLFKMWWTGQYNPQDRDLSPGRLRGVGDRIYYGFSEDGQHWSSPQVVLKGESGLTGGDAADDHLVGAPSVLKISGTYYMFYEAYGDWATVINRFFDPARGDNWVTNGLSDQNGTLNDWVGGYNFERALGFAPAFQKAGTHPVYSGQVQYSFGKINRFLSKTPGPVGSDAQGNQWQQLNGGTAVFWLYDQAAPGRKAIYSFFDSAHSNTYATDDPHGDGVPGATLVEVLGYSDAALNSPDMAGALQTRIMLATSTDGVHWSRFAGSARGGAVIAPQNEFTNQYPHDTAHDPAVERWDIHRHYGSGLPIALERDRNLELYFTDDSKGTAGSTQLWRIRIPSAQITNPAAYANATRQRMPWWAHGGLDIKWSPFYQRYFIDAADNGSPQLYWTDRGMDLAAESSLPAPITLPKPTEGHSASWGGIAGDGLGHTLDFTGANPYSAFHFYYSTADTSNLGHSLLFGYPADAHGRRPVRLLSGRWSDLVRSRAGPRRIAMTGSPICGSRG